MVKVAVSVPLPAKRPVPETAVKLVGSKTVVVDWDRGGVACTVPTLLVATL